MNTRAQLIDAKQPPSSQPALQRASVPPRPSSLPPRASAPPRPPRFTRTPAGARPQPWPRPEHHPGPSQAPARAPAGLSSRQADLRCFWDTRRGLRRWFCNTRVRQGLAKVGRQESWVQFSVTLGKPFPSSGPQFPLGTLRALQCYHPALSLCLRVGLVSGFNLSNTSAPGSASQSLQKHPLTPGRPEAPLTEPHSRDQRPLRLPGPNSALTPRGPASPAPVLGCSCRGRGSVLIPLEARPHTHLFQT